MRRTAERKTGSRTSTTRSEQRRPRASRIRVTVRRQSKDGRRELTTADIMVAAVAGGNNKARTDIESAKSDRANTKGFSCVRIER